MPQKNSVVFQSVSVLQHKHICATKPNPKPPFRILIAASLLKYVLPQIHVNLQPPIRSFNDRRCQERRTVDISICRCFIRRNVGLTCPSWLSDFFSRKQTALGHPRNRSLENQNSRSKNLMVQLLFWTGAANLIAICMKMASELCKAFELKRVHKGSHYAKLRPSRISLRSSFPCRPFHPFPFNLHGFLRLRRCAITNAFELALYMF